MKNTKLVERITQMQKRTEMLSEETQPTSMKYSKQERKAFLEACKRYKEYKEQFPNSKELQNKLSEIAWIVETAENMTLQETESWFDNVTVSRHMKQLKEAYKVMEKTANELIQTQQRFESAYDDIGSILNKYYEI
jgi:virulence-associated protein VapD